MTPVFNGNTIIGSDCILPWAVPSWRSQFSEHTQCLGRFSETGFVVKHGVTINLSIFILLGM